MFKDAYDTTICRHYAGAMLKIVEGIRSHRALGGEQFKIAVNPLTEDEIWEVTTLVGGHAPIASFSHPVLVPYEDADNFGVFVDVRNTTRRTADGAVIVSSSMDYRFSVLRGFFQSIWTKYGARDIQTLGNFPITIYARWVSEVLTKRFALPPETQMTVTAIAAYFYLCLFIGDEVTELDERERVRMASAISRSTYMNTEDVLTIIAEYPLLRNVQDFIDLLIKEAGTVRFENFNEALLFTVVSGSWFGANSKEVGAVALEHPPTFVAMVVMACDERGYRNTVFGKLVEQYKKDDELRSFQLNCKRLQRQ